MFRTIKWSELFLLFHFPVISRVCFLTDNIMPVVELTTKLGHILYIIYYYIYSHIFTNAGKGSSPVTAQKGQEVTHRDECIWFGSLRYWSLL